MATAPDSDATADAATRSDESSDAAATARETTPRTAAVAVRRPVDADPDRVAGLVVDRAREARDEGDGIASFLPRDDGVRTLTAFLERPPDRRAALVWYVEVDAPALDAGAWSDPLSAVRERVESAFGDLPAHLADPGDARVLADGVEGAAPLVHEGLGDRPSAFGTRADGPPVVLAAGEGDPPDVVAVRPRVARPVGAWFLRGFARLVGFLDDDGWVERRFREASREVLEEERMYTESILLERTDGDHFLWWYMEAEDMDRVTEAYEASSDLVARASDVVLGFVLEEPGELFEPVQYSNHEPLVHAVDPDRPGFGND